MKDQIRAGIQQTTPFDALYNVVVTLRAQGTSADALMETLEALRSQVTDEQEDILLDVMDCLVGWCAAHMVID